jgi:hypothetical protein
LAPGGPMKRSPKARFAEGKDVSGESSGCTASRKVCMTGGSTRAKSPCGNCLPVGG